MHAAGVRQINGPVEALLLPDPRPLRADEILIDVQAAGVGNWDEFIRTGGWDIGTRPPMALGVEAAGVVVATGSGVAGFAAGDRVLVHSAPVREQGAWAGRFVAATADCAVLPDDVPLEVGGALPVPALTADQTVSDTLRVAAGQTILVNGASGVTGGMLVQLAVHYGARVIATAGPDNAARVTAMGAAHVLDYHESGWPEKVRALTGGGVDAAANAAREGSAAAIKAVRDGGTLATITADLPAAERGITMTAVLVAPDGARLAKLAGLAAQGALSIASTRVYPLGQAGEALLLARHGVGGAAVVLRTTRDEEEARFRARTSTLGA